MVVNFSCVDNKDKTTNTLEGSWISSEATSWKFLSGTQKVFLNFQKDQHSKLKARLIFIWNNEYQSEWNLTKVKYDTLNNYITIEDDDGNSLHADFDPIKNRILGTIHTSADNSTDSLNFESSRIDIETTMLHPRPENVNGNITYKYQQPEQLNDFLATGSIYDEGVDSSMMNKLMLDIMNQDYGRIESFLVLKDNTLVLEEYFYGYDKTKKHNFNSCTKSITSLLLGIALNRHPELDPEQSIFHYLPQYDSLKTVEKEKITLNNFLTMSTGLDWNEYPKEMYENNDRIVYVLSRPLTHSPGDYFQYNSGNAAVIGRCISSLIRSDVQGFADSTFFHPLGITEYSWRKHTNGELEFWNGLKMKPRDMAKIGLLVQNEGKWNNKQLVPKEWIIESTRPHIKESDFFNYGYQWWIRSKECKKWWKDSIPGSVNDYEMIVALGSGGNYIIIINELKLVIVTNASNFSNDKALIVFPMIIKKLIPAIKYADLKMK